jgi:hypothetical protein
VRAVADPSNRQDVPRFRGRVEPITKTAASVQFEFADWAALPRQTAPIAERNRLRTNSRKNLRNSTDLNWRREWESGRQSSKTLRNFAKRHEIRPLRAASFFRFCRPFTTVFGFCQRDVTRNVTRVGPLPRASLLKPMRSAVKGVAEKGAASIRLVVVLA